MNDEVDRKAEATTDAWRAAGERGDVDAAIRCLADQVEVISPLTAQFRFHGREQVRDMLTAAFGVITGIRFHTQVGDGVTRALFYHAHVDRQPIEEAQLLRLDPEGLISELTLFARPLPGVTAVMAGIGPGLLRRQGRTPLAAVVGASARPFATLTRVSEHRVVPLVDPNRS